MKKKIALVTGGYSSEHQISLNSSREIARAIDPARYEVYPIHITRDSWVYKPAAGDPSPVDRNDFSIRIGKEKVLFDAAFVVIHGSPGEDGQMEGYFDMLNIPYTCSGVLASALTFDKIACKQYLAPFGVKYAPTVVLRKGEKLDSGQIINELGLPLFVKPNEGGSSFGITKVKEVNGLDTAVRKAFEEDSTVLAEAFLQGTEITCGLIKTLRKDYIFPLCEIVPKNDFFDFEAKYTPGMADEIVPARVPDPISRECQELSSRIYSLLDCRGLVRIDYIWTAAGIYFLEVNTIPGMSAESIVPKMMRYTGVDPGEVFGLMIEDCIERRRPD